MTCEDDDMQEYDTIASSVERQLKGLSDDIRTLQHGFIALTVLVCILALLALT